MSYVDRSGTNWMPIKALRGANPRLVVFGGVATIMTAAYGMLKLRQSYSPPAPQTMSKEWSDATAEKIRSGVEREAAEPIPINPITHHKLD